MAHIVLNKYLLNEYILECLTPLPLENHSQLMALLFFLEMMGYKIQSIIRNEL